MKTKTLESIQKISKVGKILSKIVEICCIVGTVLCVIGAVFMSAGQTDTIKIGDVSMHSLIEQSTEMSVGTMWAGIIIGLIACIIEWIIARMTGKYFKHELMAGTPFTFDGAKELKRTGVFMIVLPLIAIMMSSIVLGVANVTAGANIDEVNVGNVGSIGMGITFIILSLIFKHGAEISEQKAN